MGLINNDVYSCASGVQKVGTYISFGTETVYLCQNSSDPSVPSADRKYNVRANYRVYWDKDCRTANKPFLDLQSVSTQLTAAQLETNLYGALYEALKVTYPNCSDEVSATPSAPSVTAEAAPSETPSAPSAESTPSEAPAEAPSAPAVTAESTPSETPSAESTPSETPSESTPSAPAESTPSAPAESTPSAPAESAPSAPAESAPSE